MCSSSTTRQDSKPSVWSSSMRLTLHRKMGTNRAGKPDIVNAAVAVVFSRQRNTLPISTSHQNDSIPSSRSAPTVLT